MTRAAHCAKHPAARAARLARRLVEPLSLLGAAVF